MTIVKVPVDKEYSKSYTDMTRYDGMPMETRIITCLKNIL